jgi:ABC-2 type transport system permease protein
MSADGMIKALKPYNLAFYVPILFFVGSSLMTFMFTTYNAKGSMFNSNDNDMLLSMPIKPSTILASRLIFIVLWNMLVSLAVMIPVCIIYAMNVHVSFSYYFFCFFIFLLLPIIPTILASVIGYAIAYFTSKSNAKNWFEIISSVAIMGIIYYVIYRGNDILNYVIAHNDELKDIVKWCFYPIYLVIEMLQDNNYLSLVIFIILNISLFVIFTNILSIKFKKIIAKLQENRTRSNFVMKSLHSESVSKSLFIKETKRYFSSPIYVFNTAFGPALIFIAAIASIFFDKSKILNAIGVSVGENMIFQFLVLTVMFIAFFTSTTSSSISIEGRNFWIMKTLPLSPSSIFKGKILLNLVLLLPIAYLSLVILYFTLNLSIIQLITLLALVSISSLLAAQFGLLVNLKFPKLNANNDTIVVKQSASAMISVLIPMATIMIISSIYTGFSDIINFNVLLGTVLIILLILCFVEHNLLETWGVKRFKQIN